MKNFPKKLIAGVLLTATAFSAVACGSNDDDSQKATLYVYSFTSGFKTEWLEALISDYEEKMKDVEIPGYPEKGIRVKPTPEGSDVDGSEMRNNKEVIYFLEQQDYYNLVAKGYVEDLTTAITSVNPYDGKTLESKMFPDQKAYLGREINGETHYYAYPHYFTSFGIIYDVELFDTKGYYFVEDYNPNGDLGDMFLGTEGVENEWPKTAGPDQTPNTADDGLPTTYEEFFLLCDYIASKKDRPLVWSGQHRHSYLTHFLNALAADYEGYQQMRLNFTFNGTATNLGTVDESGNFVFDAEDTPINGENGAELARQAGKYYSMDFYQTLYNKPYINKEATKNEKDEFNTSTTLFSSTYSHTTAQNDFLKRGQNRNAMLLDGSWWQQEATEMFEMMGANPALSKQNRKLGWMPLPKQSSEKVGEKQTMYDIMYPLLMMKSGVDPDSWQYKYALDFIQFANSDEQLAQFTQITGSTKALNYSLTGDQYNGLSYYGKTFYDAYKSSDIVFPYANNMIFANNQNIFRELWDGTCSPLYKSAAYTGTFTMALEANVSLKKYFDGMYENFSKLSIWKKI